MKIKNETKFHIKMLNQEKFFNKLSKQFNIFGIDRLNEKEVIFSCDFSQRKNVEKLLKENNIEILEIQNFGALANFSRIWTSFGLIFALIFISVFLFVQSQFILRFEVYGTEKLDKKEVSTYISANFQRKKSKLKTESVEMALLENFHEISFVSCMIKGQTLVINIKEKLLPDEKYGEFKPIVSSKDAKITKIELISGSLKVKVGDVVRAGDILVEPFTLDSSGEIMKTEAKAVIEADVYNEGSADHYDSFVEVYRTGKTCEESVVTLFGLEIYKFESDIGFERFEVEETESDLSQNNFLPFKLKKKKYFELKDRVVESDFEDVKEEYLQKARANALEKCSNCDKIIEEYYTTRHLSGVTIINYCIVTREEIGRYAD